ncbi:MAG TPA: hypothetical protein DD640_07480 [Clostridiales bacterium]|nr:hypothetical protein [Clostridiales bacterium]
MFQLMTALQDVLAEERTLTGQSGGSECLEEKIRRIQAGDSDLRNQVITDCLPYIKGVLWRMLQLPAIEQADEFSVALTAFNDALDHYRSETHVPFLRYAGLVINRRIIDWLRQQRKHRQVLTFSQCAGEEGEDFAENLVGQSGEQIWENMEIEEELVRFRMRLLDYNLTLSDIAKRFPHHRDARLTCIRAARILLAEPDLKRRFTREYRLPAADLARRSPIPLKTIERNRTNIIFLALLLDSGLEVIKACLAMYGKEESQ